MKLDKQDIKSIAMGRVNQAERKSFYIAMIVVFAGGLIGAFSSRYSVIGGWIIMGVAVGYYFWYTYQFTQKQKNYTAILLKEWESESK